MEMHDLCAIAARERRCVLATAIKVEGHAYRKQGVSMLLTEDGTMYGSISPGCLESDIQARVSRVLDTKQMEFAEYDMRPEDDLSWGETIGCGGLIIVLLEPVCGEFRSILQKMHECLQSGAETMLIRTFRDHYTRIEYDWKRIESDEVDENPLIAKHQSNWCPSRVLPYDHVENRSRSPVLSDEQHSQYTSNAIIAKNDSASVHPWGIPEQFTSKYTPTPRLIIIGAGNDVVPVVRLARAAGFRVVVADWRESLCTSERFSGAELVPGFPREVMPLLNVNNRDYIILMSHQFPRERELLEILVHCEYAYLGVMGSKTRTARLLDGLPRLKHVHSPVGLSIGADGPEEIAISIVAELIACIHKISFESYGVQRGNVVHANDGHCSGGR
ncbi:XdhC family protein [Paenibacillus sp. PCH8]|uniref:XdhC family protein n=1 Tax=Paenibacillus sp. PCH8 TaxID=2066524 RepID=UPI0015E29127|nr:XdhC/CoxI family protein [Paenibacillus sp. PCH8]